MGCDLQFTKCPVVCNLEAVGSADTSLWLVSASPTFFSQDSVSNNPSVEGFCHHLLLVLVSFHQPTQPQVSVPSNQHADGTCLTLSPTP